MKRISYEEDTVTRKLKREDRPKKVGGVPTYAGLADVIKRDAPSRAMREALLSRETHEDHDA